MTVDRIINLLATITLFEMMVTIGLGVTVAEVAGVAKDWGMLARAALANYVLVPAAAVGLLLLLHASPLVAAGFLIAAVCPGAPYGPPFTGMAKGNVAVSVGLMIVLAGSSALVAPFPLRLLLPLTSGDQQVQVDALKVAGTLFLAQLLPLGVGLLVRHRRPALADRLTTPARRLSLILNVATLGAILAVQLDMLIGIPARGFAGMSALVLAAVAAGWLLGGPGSGTRTAMAMATSVRNVARGGQPGYRHGELSRHARRDRGNGVRAVPDDRHGVGCARLGPAGAGGLARRKAATFAALTRSCGPKGPPKIAMDQGGR